MEKVARVASEQYINVSEGSGHEYVASPPNDLRIAAALHPKFLSVGGNTGTTNSFTGANITDLTAGVSNALTLTQGNNLGCFAYQLAAQAKPDIALNIIDALGNPLSDVLEQFPGYAMSQ
ncbi:hypothetical protein EJ03DRAFT_349120 [Teratosphaeria nubilosa]|uniref:Uncharacterized protein n=1 Tax=Teratosphaeria nubilosa TaxID=161662 RepID=A0A6G1LIB6_9PEZI|nr:hypothetical protein EJ03DRAFT_349120 [Teratosphaeria nubilosa]